MKEITLDDVNQIIDTLPENRADHFKYLFDQIESEQPEIFDFLHSDPELNEEELDLLLTVSMIGWYIVKQILNCTEEVSEDFMYEQYYRNYASYQNEIYESKKNNSEIHDILSHPNNQPFLMGYIVYLITKTMDKPDSGIRESMIPSITVNCKTVIDCLVLDEDEELAEICDSEYSDKSLTAVRDTVKKYSSEFQKTASYMKLTPDEKDETDFMIVTFGEMMYRFFLLTPAHWNGRRIVECLTKIMPAKVMAGDIYFQAVEPVMTAFLIFCGEKGYVPEGQTMAFRLRDITEDIMKEAGNSENWGEGKVLLKEAEKQGYDLSKKEDIDAFMRQQTGKKGSPNLHPVENIDKKTGRNDPCPCGSGKKFKKCCGAN